MRPSIIARVPNGKRSADSVDLHEDSQNSLIIDSKTHMTTKNLSMKILIQSLSRLLPDDIIEELLKEAASRNKEKKRCGITPEVIVINSLFE